MRNGFFGVGDRGAKIDPKTISQRRDRKSETTTREKWPEKRPFYWRAISCGFRRTGWWRPDGSRLDAHHSAYRTSLRRSQEREFSMQRQGDKISDFGTYSTAETAQTKKPGTHVFDNSDVLRVSLSHHNYREWVVETKGIETGCPPHSHRTGLETESGTEIFDAETERRNRPICRVSVNKDRAISKIRRTCL